MTGRAPVRARGDTRSTGVNKKKKKKNQRESECVCEREREKRVVEYAKVGVVRAREVRFEVIKEGRPV